MKIRVAHVTFDLRIGGAERVIHSLVEHTDRDRFDVSVLCLEDSVGPFGRDLRGKGWLVATLGRRPGFDRELVRRVRRHVRAEGVEVLHCHQYTPYVYGILGSLGTGASVIFTEHGRLYPDRPRWKRRLLNPWLARLTRHVTAISRATRSALEEIENFPRGKVRVVYNGIDGAPYGMARCNGGGLRRELALPPGARLLGTVARLDPIKNQAMMIRALRRVRLVVPEVHLVLVGDGPERGRLEQLARQEGVAEAVHFTGFRDDVPAVMAALDAFLLTSFTEGTAMTLLEAMAAGTPCVATDVGGNPEIVIDGQTGYLVASDDDARLAERIGVVLGEPGRAAELGEAGRRLFTERYTVENMVDAYEALYGGGGCAS